MDHIGELDFTSDKYIFYMLLNNRKVTSIATFGNLQNNKLLMYLDFLDRVCNIILLNTKKVYDGEPTIKESDNLANWNPPGMIDVKEDISGEPLIVDDFEVYLGEDNIVILFGDQDELRNNKGVVSFNKKSDISRCTFGYDTGLKLRYIKIKEITQQEKNKFIGIIIKKGIPIEKKGI